MLLSKSFNLNETSDIIFSESSFVYIVKYCPNDNVVGDTTFVRCEHKQENYVWSLVMNDKTNSESNKSLKIPITPLYLYKLLYQRRVGSLDKLFEFKFPETYKAPTSSLELKLLIKLPHDETLMDTVSFFLEPTEISESERFNKKLFNLRESITAEYNNEIAALKDENDELKTELASLKNELSNLSIKISSITTNSNDHNAMMSFLANYATKNDLANCATKAELAGCTTNLANCATKGDLANYSTKSDLANCATKGDLANYSTKSDLANYSTKGDLGNYSTKGDLANYATKADLGNYSIKGDLANYATKGDLANYAIKADLGNYSIKGDLANYSTKGDLANYATKAEFAGCATKAELANYVVKT
jgi:hypothetical protein